MGRKRRAVEPVRLEDGHYWYRNFINLPGGGHVQDWKLAEIVGGKFRRIGVKAEWEQDCDYLLNALWVRIDPPPPRPATRRRSAREAKFDRPIVSHEQVVTMSIG